tara:strand:+ start:1786 stop:2580 length:795 start_codon:yes stop_codon:yes gene_type:complete
MVNQAEQPENAPSEDFSGGTTTDITNEFSGVNTFEESTAPIADEAPEAAPEVEAPVEGATETPAPVSQAEPVAEPETPVTDANPAVDDLQQRMQEIEQQNLQYRAQQQQGQLHQQTNGYREQLEQAGYLPDQAASISQNWAAQQSQVAQIQQQSEEQARFLQGQANAAEVFATKYKLELNDLAELRKFPDPQQMEGAAKRLRTDRDKDAEIAKLKAQLVPAQNFDNSQSTPVPSNDESRWLDRYNQGDRSAQASAAARRAAGLG